MNQIALSPNFLESACSLSMSTTKIILIISSSCVIQDGDWVTVVFVTLLHFLVYEHSIDDLCLMPNIWTNPGFM